MWTEKNHDCVAKGAVWCKLFSVKFPANSEQYGESCGFGRNTKAVSAGQWMP
jgi:hypothetical protein